MDVSNNSTLYFCYTVYFTSTPAQISCRFLVHLVSFLPLFGRGIEATSPRKVLACGTSLEMLFYWLYTCFETSKASITGCDNGRIAGNPGSTNVRVSVQCLLVLAVVL